MSSVSVVDNNQVDVSEKKMSGSDIKETGYGSGTGLDFGFEQVIDIDPTKKTGLDFGFEQVIDIDPTKKTGLDFGFEQVIDVKPTKKTGLDFGFEQTIQPIVEPIVKSTSTEQNLDEELSEDKKQYVIDKNTNMNTDVNTNTNINVTPVFTCDGERPFKNAMEQYKKILNNEIENAKAHLSSYPNHDYAKLTIPLFEKIQVLCTDQFGNKKTKIYMVHELHYGPLINAKLQKDIVIDPLFKNWYGFYARYNYIWTQVNAMNKLPGGDGTGKDGTACSPFRDCQVKLLKEDGLYLVDTSDVVFDTVRNKYRYRINITLYRNKPINGPFRMPHGYGFIPNLGSSPKSFVEPEPMPQQQYQQKIQQPRFQQPRFQQPRFQQPRFQQPRFQQPRFQQPQYFQQQHDIKNVRSPIDFPVLSVNKRFVQKSPQTKNWSSVVSASIDKPMSTKKTVSVNKSVSVDKLNPVINDIISDQTTDIAPDQTTSIVSDQTTSNVSDQTTSIVSDQTTDIVTDQTTSIVSDQTTDIVTDQTTSIVSDQTTSNVSDQTTSNVSDQTTDIVSDQTADISVTSVCV
jgi:hypothetical protein